MTEKQKIKYEEMALISKALAHPTRLFIVHELSTGERCVCELTDMIKADVSTVSKHLSVLKNAGIIASQKRGNMVYYQLSCTCALDFFDCIINVINSNRENYLQKSQNVNLTIRN